MEIGVRAPWHGPDQLPVFSVILTKPDLEFLKEKIEGFSLDFKFNQLGARVQEAALPEAHTM